MPNSDKVKFRLVKAINKSREMAERLELCIERFVYLFELWNGIFASCLKTE